MVSSAKKTRKKGDKADDMDWRAMLLHLQEVPGLGDCLGRPCAAGASRDAQLDCPGRAGWTGCVESSSRYWEIERREWPCWLLEEGEH